MIKRTAACSCGQLTAITTEEPIRISVCHCLDCQRRTGSVFGAQARFRRKTVELAGRSAQYVRVNSKERNVIFNFCPHCSAIVYYHLEGDDEIIGVPIGAFADPQFPPPTVSAWEEDKHPWVTLPRDIQHMA